MFGFAHLASNRPTGTAARVSIVGAIPILYALLLVMASNGYPIFGLITTIVVPGESTINYGFRAGVVALSSIVAASSLLYSYRRPITLVVLIFFLLYSARLYYDIFITYLPDADIAGTYFFGTVVIPIIAVSVGATNFDDRLYAFWSFLVCGLTSLAVIGASALNLAAAIDTMGEAGRLTFEALNPITIGYVGAFTVLSSMALWKRTPIQWRWALVAGIAVGGYVIVLSGSRGPLVSVVVCFAFIAAVQKRFILLTFSCLLGAYLALFAADSDLSIVTRFQAVGTDLSSAERLEVMRNAVDQTIAHPVLGNAYVEVATMSYPHNLLVESGMAIGILGVLLMVVLQVRMLFAAWRLGRDGHLFVAMAIVSALVNANLSASLWQSEDFWQAATLAVLLPSLLLRKRVTPRGGDPAHQLSLGGNPRLTRTVRSPLHS